MLNPISFVKHVVDLFDQRICRLSEHEVMESLTQSSRRRWFLLFGLSPDKSLPDMWFWINFHLSGFRVNQEFDAASDIAPT